MEESYCGRSCRECKKKELIRCYGCKTETINNLGNDCEMAKCAFDKGLDSCRMCENKGSCSGLRTREEMPNYQSRESRNVYLINREEAERKEMLVRRAPLLGKWLWVLFWFPILSLGISLLSAIPDLAIVGTVISIVLGIARGGIFIKISPEEKRYKAVGICAFIVVLVDKILFAVNGSDELWWALFIIIPIAIVGLVGIYNEFMGHAAVLESIDDNLSEKWRKLWKWYIGSLLGLIGCVFVMVVAPVLGLLLVFAGVIGILVCVILSWVYLYRTAKVFRGYEDK